MVLNIICSSAVKNEKQRLKQRQEQEKQRQERLRQQEARQRQEEKPEEGGGSGKRAWRR